MPTTTKVRGGKPGARFISKGEVLDRTAISFPTIWQWMRDGTFPRARSVGGKSMWIESEIDNWILNRPLRKLKGDKAAA
jgi:predicted DNA-binding transcriptional regulator AlpA